MNLSSDLIIETNALIFKFKDQLILNGLNLQVAKGSIYGFLGPNGAGKTTTIRLLLGLLPVKNNRIRIFNENQSTTNRSKAFSKIGSLIEHPSLYEHLSAWNNLEITRRLRNINKERMYEVLELVNLSDASKKLVKNYSLGMKQRLGLALALMPKPELLILDEPINGLDPAGIIEIRELLLRLNQEQGITIFLSSHLLPEIEKLVTHLGILNNGNLIYQGTIDQLTEMNNSKRVIQIETDDLEKARVILNNRYKVLKKDNVLEISFQSKQQIASIGRELIQAGINLYQLNVLSKNLEATFMEMTQPEYDKI